MKAMPYIAILSVFLCSCLSRKSNNDSNFYFPPEWEPHESVWLGWSKSSSIEQLHVEMAKAIYPYVNITVLARSDSLLNRAFAQLLAAGIDTSRVKGFVHYIPNVFIRDAGPRFLKSDKNELAVADFGWNHYGYPEEFENTQFSNERGAVDNDVANQLGLRMISTPVVAEGGGLDVSNHL